MSKLFSTFIFIAKQTHKSSDTKNTNTILVENVPPTADEDLLEVFFESTKKYGGGPVTEVRIIRDRNIAYVKFCEASAVETVMKKKPIMLGTTKLAVKPFKHLLPENETITRVDVMGLLVSKDFTEGLLEKYSGPPPVPTYGPELAALMKVGTRVVRGKDWKWGDQDGGGKGHVIENIPGLLTCFIRVKWDNGVEGDYIMGAQNCYDLQIVPKI